MSCIFCQITYKEIKSQIVYEDDWVVVFPDIHPQAKIHLLVVPKKHIEELCQLEDLQIWSKILEAVKKILEKYGLSKIGYRIVINGGGAQLINHLHVHLLGEIKKEIKF